jgi:GxxExxY protein
MVFLPILTLPVLFCGLFLFTAALFDKSRYELNRQDAKNAKIMRRVIERSFMGEPDQSLDRLAHTVIGQGFLESVYQNALCYELDLRNIQYVAQAPVSVMYKGHSVGEGRIDILIENRLIVESKAVEAFEAIHHAQVISYLKATNLFLGLLINFNLPILKDGIRRIILSR